MKILLFTLLISISISSNAIELNSCTDESGMTHYTNLPINSLDSHCKPKDLFSTMLQQDYDNLINLYPDYNTEADNVESLNTDKNITLTKKLKNKISDVFDSEKAFDELMQSTEDRDDFFTKAIRGRSEGIKNIIKQGKND